jgi:DNA-binding PadR family transcriptional regulator
LPKNAISAPKGLLKILILDITSMAPSSGVEIANKISEMTKGTWKPSPGSTYYILERLAKEELISEIFTLAGGQKKYITTVRGKSYLRLEREALLPSWSKHLILTKVMADILGIRFDIQQETRTV